MMLITANMVTALELVHSREILTWPYPVSAVGIKRKLINPPAVYIPESLIQVPLCTCMTELLNSGNHKINKHGCF